MSFRTRLLLASLTTLVVGLGAILVLGNVLLSRGVKSEISSVLHARAQAQLAALVVDRTGVRVLETANDQQLDKRAWVIQGVSVVERPEGVSPQLDRTAIALARRGRAAEANGPGEIRLLAQPVRGRGVASPRPVVVVGLSKEPLEDLQREVLIGSLVVAALILFAGGLAIRSAVDGALRPVAEMTASAADWGAHDLEHRFGMGPPRDELTGLAATLDGLLARIAASRRHEQRFASEVAHELRTPVAGLRGRVELALRARGTEAEAEREAALRAVLEQVERLGATIDDLLAMARQELDASSGTVDLLSLARELDDVEIDADPDLPLAEGDPDVVRRALAPLIDNARRHARGVVKVELSTTGDRVLAAVRDDGPGLDAAIAERVFEPGFRSGSDTGSAGLGLPLARRLARSCGGEVSAGDGPGGCFVLELPRAA